MQKSRVGFCSSFLLIVASVCLQESAFADTDHPIDTVVMRAEFLGSALASGCVACRVERKAFLIDRKNGIFVTSWEWGISEDALRHFIIVDGQKVEVAFLITRFNTLAFAQVVGDKSCLQRVKEWTLDLAENYSGPVHICLEGDEGLVAWREDSTDGARFRDRDSQVAGVGTPVVGARGTVVGVVDESHCLIRSEVINVYYERIKEKGFGVSLGEGTANILRRDVVLVAREAGVPEDKTRELFPDSTSGVQFYGVDLRPKTTVKAGDVLVSVEEDKDVRVTSYGIWARAVHKALDRGETHLNVKVLRGNEVKNAEVAFDVVPYHTDVVFLGEICFVWDERLQQIMMVANSVGQGTVLESLCPNSMLERINGLYMASLDELWTYLTTYTGRQLDLVAAPCSPVRMICGASGPFPQLFAAHQLFRTSISGRMTRFQRNRGGLWREVKQKDREDAT